MEFRTKVPLSKSTGSLIDYDSFVFLMGSCFSDEIGLKLEDYQFKSLSNPFGIVFNPVAMEALTTRVVEGVPFTLDQLSKHEELFFSLEAHSRFSSTNADVVLRELNDALLKSRACLLESSHVIITLGTAWAYRYIETDRIVANCHKIPQKNFRKELLSVERITSALEGIMNDITILNPNLNFVFTISPVRHLRDGFVENNKSKAHLITAVHKLVEQNTSAYYFPSYEVLMDELRDYRFYKDDMVHPSPQSVNYVWEHFTTTWLSASALETLKKVQGLKKDLEHEPMNPGSQNHIKFLSSIEQKRQQLQKAIPHLNL